MPGSKNTQHWDRPNASKPEILQAAGQLGAAAWGYARDGINTALADYCGSTDPSTGESWGADQVGRKWCDDTTPANLKFYRWCQLTSAPTYGWRELKVRKAIDVESPPSVTFSPASPAAANVAWTAVDLTTLLDGAGVQDAAAKACAVVWVLLYVTVKGGASETIGAANAFIAFRKKGATNQEIRVKCYVAAMEHYGIVPLPLDSGEEFEFKVEVGGGTPAFEYAAKVLSLQEVAW